MPTFNELIIIIQRKLKQLNRRLKNDFSLFLFALISNIMAKTKIEFIPSEEKPPKKWKKITASLIIAIILTMVIFSSSAIFSDQGLIEKFNLVNRAKRLILSQDKSLVGETKDRVNILIIGIGGAHHQGGSLADTIILGAFRPSTKEAAMLSLPRDLSIPTERSGWIKINAVHAFAEAKEPNSGGRVMAENLSQLLDLEIHYYAVVDFTGFEKIIDEFGGVEVEVERDLIDYRYPIKGKEYVYPIENRFETLKIKKGLRQMDGELALKYARSRHALGIEGSDFARSRRQQKIITALKEKVFELNTFLNPKRISALLDAYQNHIRTNLTIGEIIRLAKLGREVEANSVINYTLSDGPSGLLYPKIINESYVLLPKNNDFSKIKKLWENIFYNPEKIEETEPAAQPSEDSSPSEQTKPSREISDNPTIEIQNGTWITGWAGQEKETLSDWGFQILAAINADSHDYQETIIYDLSGGMFPKAVEKLEARYSCSSTKKIPIGLDSRADFLIILGSREE